MKQDEIAKNLLLDQTCDNCRHCVEMTKNIYKCYGRERVANPANPANIPFRVVVLWNPKRLAKEHTCIKWQNYPMADEVRKLMSDINNAV